MKLERAGVHNKSDEDVLNFWAVVIFTIGEICLGEVGIAYMDVAAGGADGAVTEKGLDCPDVGSGFML